MNGENRLLENLMERLKAGDISALDGIYSATARGAYLLAYSVLKDKRRAEDVSHDAFLRVAANAALYKEGGSVKAWILKIARNLAYREFNLSKRVTSLDKAAQKAEEEAGGVNADVLVLKDALELLDPDEREIVTLYSLEGYKHKEVAEIVGKPDGTVRWLYSEALKKLKKELGISK